MKILQLCNRYPYPPRDGGSLAIFNMARALKNAGAEVEMLAINTSRHPVNPFSAKENGYGIPIASVPVDTSLNARDAFQNLFSSESYHIIRFYSAAFERVLIEKLTGEKFDLVQLESLFMMPYVAAIRRSSKARIVFRAHNVEHRIWEQITEMAPPGPKKYYLSLLTKRLKRYEISHLNACDLLLPITESDAGAFRSMGCIKPMLTSSFAVFPDDYRSGESASREHPGFFHIGSMDWKPNIQGIEWLLNKVWKRFPGNGIRLILAGRNMPESFRKKKLPGLTISGEVGDSSAFMQQHDIMLVPLHSGSGMRVKIIEAMALGKAIISTSLGAEGIHYTNEENILIADTPEAFKDAMQRLLQDKIFRMQLGKNARTLVEAEYNATKQGADILHFYNRQES